MSTIVVGGLVLSADCASTLELDLLVDDGVIVAVEPRGTFATTDAEVIDASGCLVTPGFINGHTHSHAGILSGIAREWTLEHSLLNGPWTAAPRSLELANLSATLAATELLASGCTALFDLAYRYPAVSIEAIHATADAYATAGIRATIAPMVADRPLHEALPVLGDCCGTPPVPPTGSGERPQTTSELLATCTQLIDTWPYDHAMLTPATAPTIPAHCTPELTQGLLRLARDNDLRLHTHLAESKPQAIAGNTRFGRSITEELARLDALGPWLTAAHTIWTSPSDNALLADHGVTAVTVPASNLRLGSGVQDSRGLLDAGVTLAIGTDGANSSDALDMVDGIRLTALLSRISERGADEWLTVPEVLRAATSGGAAALGRADTLGTIAPGFAADLVLHDLGGSATYSPRTDLLNQLVTAGRATDVRTVLVAGRTVYDRGSYPGLDIATLRARASDLTAEYFESTATTRADVATYASRAAASLAAERARPWPVQRLLPIPTPISNPTPHPTSHPTPHPTPPSTSTNSPTPTPNPSPSQELP